MKLSNAPLGVVDKSAIESPLINITRAVIQECITLRDQQMTRVKGKIDETCVRQNCYNGWNKWCESD